LDHDLSLLGAVAQAITDRSQRQGVAIELQVDANGGWTVNQARQMLEPLAAHQVVLLEQPLAPRPGSHAGHSGIRGAAPALSDGLGGG